MKNNIKSNVEINLKKVRKFVIVFGIVAFLGLVPSLFLRIVTPIATAMTFLFNVFLAGKFWPRT